MTRVNKKYNVDPMIVDMTTISRPLTNAGVLEMGAYSELALSLQSSDFCVWA